MSRNRIAVTAVAVQLGIMFIGAILPTPLYPLYREAFGFSGVTLTLIYATYVLGNLAALLFFGRLADQIGRRSASVPAVAVGMLSAVLFAAAQSTGWLFAARGAMWRRSMQMPRTMQFSSGYLSIGVPLLPKCRGASICVPP